MTKEEQRQSVVFFANVELQLVLGGTFTSKDVDGYWADVLKQAPTAPQPPHWCGALALHCLHQAGLLIDQLWMFGPPNYGFLYRLKQLLPGELPKPGDIGYQDRPYQHHFVVDHVDDAGEIVHTIEGNQGKEHPITAGQRRIHAPGVTYHSIERLLSEPAPPEAA